MFNLKIITFIEHYDWLTPTRIAKSIKISQYKLEAWMKNDKTNPIPVEKREKLVSHLRSHGFKP